MVTYLRISENLSYRFDIEEKFIYSKINRLMVNFLKKFRDGKYRVLITTDVAARGLDIPEVDLVIVCSPPKVREFFDF